MTDQPQENVDATQADRERESETLREDQRGKGYGEDEGEREESLPED